MAFDGIVLHGIIYELGGLITGGRVEKIYQPGPDDIVMLIHAGREHYRLALSADPASAGMHLTKSKKENPALPPPFCMVLRKYLSGSRIASVSQQGFDRVAAIEFETRNEMGDNETKKLILEIMNRQSNLILVNSAGVIHDAIRHADSSVNRFREVMPARPYTPPPAQDKLSPDDISEAEIMARVFPEASSETASVDGEKLTASRSVLNALYGFSPLLCDSICLKVGIPPKTPLRALYGENRSSLCREILNVSREISENEYRPAIILSGKDFHCLSVCGEMNGPARSFSTVNMAVDAFFSAKEQQASFDREKAKVMRVITGNIEKLSGKISEYRRELEGAEGYQREKQKGELLTASLYNLPETADSVTVNDYYTDGAPEIIIELDGSKTVAANAQLFFKRYRKHKATCENVDRMLKKALPELDYLENVAAMLKNASSPAEVADIRAELTDEGFYSDNMGKGRSRGNFSAGPADSQPWSATMGGKPASKKTLRERANAAKASKTGKAGKQKSGAGSGGSGIGIGEGDASAKGEEYARIGSGQSQPLVRTSPEGKRVLIGRNSRQNEKLTLRDAAPEDLWFHVKNAPGSHVVLKLKEAGNAPAGDDDIVFAAKIAAYYSSQRGGSKVDVDYTTVKNVKKIPGGRPGMVNYYNFKTVTVAPADPEA